MKKLIALVLLSTFMLSFSGGLVRDCYAGWVDDWLQQKTVSSPDYTEGQKRGYFTAGSFDARWYQSDDYLMSINPPKFKAGCGGIDAFMGGFSYLNFNYLVQKLQGMLQAAPAVAFDIALQVLSEQASTTLGKFENIIDKLNHLNLDDCKASKALVATIASPILGNEMPANYQSALSDFEESSGISGLWKDTENETNSNNGNSTTDLSNMLSGCPPEVKNLFGTNGSVLFNIGNQFGINQDYIDLMRGFVGDVTLANVSGAPIQASYIPTCDQDKSSSIDNFITGNVYARPAGGGACYQITDTNRNLEQWAQNTMMDVVYDLETKSPLSSSDYAFMQAIPLPLWPVLKYAVSQNQQGAMVAQLSDTVARAYAFAMMSDLYHETRTALEKAYMIRTAQPGASANQPEYTCKIDLSGAPEEVRKLNEKLFKMQQALYESYTSDASKLTSLVTLADKWQDFNNRAYQELSQKFNPSLATRALGQ